MNVADVSSHHNLHYGGFQTLHSNLIFGYSNKNASNRESAQYKTLLGSLDTNDDLFAK